MQKVRVFANLLYPATRNLLPAVSEIPAANAATIALAKPSTPVLRDEIRPFVVAARPLVRNLRPAAINLTKATPSLSSVFTVLNHLFNILGYFPGGAQHGYLWWLAWGDHDARTLFSIQDANGDFRPLFIEASCASLAQVVSSNLGGPVAEELLNVTGILTSKTLCPKQATADARDYAQWERKYGTQNTIANLAGTSVSSLVKNGSRVHLFYPQLPTN